MNWGGFLMLKKYHLFLKIIFPKIIKMRAEMWKKLLFTKARAVTAAAKPATKAASASMKF